MILGEYISPDKDVQFTQLGSNTYAVFCWRDEKPYFRFVTDNFANAEKVFQSEIDGKNRQLEANGGIFLTNW